MDRNSELSQTSRYYLCHIHVPVTLFSVSSKTKGKSKIIESVKIEIAILKQPSHFTSNTLATTLIMLNNGFRLPQDVGVQEQVGHVGKGQDHLDRQKE